MARIHPSYPATSGDSSGGRCGLNTSSLEGETYTVWLKSLVFHGKGCTVFDSKGEIVFRVENYQKGCSRQVFLMDSCGRVLFNMNKKLRLWGSWEGFKWNDESMASRRPWFRVVTRNHAFWNKDISCRVSLKCDENTGGGGGCYRISGLEGKSSLEISDASGQLFAEAVQKQSTEGVPLGKDVLTLKVEAKADHSLVMALVTVYGLITNSL